MHAEFIDELLANWPAPALVPESALLRAVIAAMVTFGLALAAGPRAVAWLATHCREPIRTSSAGLARLHQAKAATPTMGGVFLVAAITLVCAVLGDWSSPLLPLILWVALGFGLIGAADDRVKLNTARRGLSARTKFVAQVCVALVTAVLLHQIHAAHDPRMTVLVPGWGSLELGRWWMLLAVCVLVGASNGVNLTDGLDGLAGGCTLVAAMTLGIIACVMSEADWAVALGLAPAPYASEIPLLCGALVGTVAGFLRFNIHPARVFMGDSGSLPLGGLLGLAALALRQELLLLIVGGVFVAETFSVMVQVGWFRCTGRRVFLCAPLHHHYQFRGWPETTIVRRFWIAAVVCAIVGLGTLKLQSTREFPARSRGAQETAQSTELFE